MAFFDENFGGSAPETQPKPAIETTADTSQANSTDLLGVMDEEDHFADFTKMRAKSNSGAFDLSSETQKSATNQAPVPDANAPENDAEVEGGHEDFDFSQAIAVTESDAAETIDTSQSAKSASFLDRLRTRRDLEYNVTFEHGPIGLDLETDWYGRQACVKGFKKMLNGEDGPAKKSGKITVGDVLVSINGETVLEMSFQETLSKLREVSNTHHTLHFKALEVVAGDLAQYAKDRGILEARKYIHENKMQYYSPPEDTEEMIYGCVERHRGAKVTAFNLHREDTGEFLCACSCDAEMSGMFVFHRIQDSHLRTLAEIPRNQDSAVYLGMMNPNFMGTGFGVHDHRVVKANSPARSLHDLALIVYQTNVLGRIPNFMNIIVPRLANEGTEEASQKQSIKDRYATLKRVRRRSSIIDRFKGMVGRKSSDSNDSAAEAGIEGSTPEDGHVLQYGALEQHNSAELLFFQTKKPSWNEDLCAWTLNFNGRVKQASKKNFLIVAEEGNQKMEDEFGEDKIFLRFGKVNKTRFTLDFRYPLSPTVALAVACTAFAKKTCSDIR